MTVPSFVQRWLIYLELLYELQKELTHNEIGAYKKFVNRGSTSYLCISCLSNRLDIPENFILQKIEHFKSQGCTLFV